MVGRAASIRWVFVMVLPVCLSKGTLKSTRMKTRLPDRSTSLTLSLFISGSGEGDRRCCRVRIDGRIGCNPSVEMAFRGVIRI